MDTNLELLGFTKEELQERVIDTLCDRLMESRSVDDEDRTYVNDSDFSRKLNEKIKTGIQEAIDALAQKHIAPNLQGLVEGIVLQKTNEWGEAKGEPVSFTEYLVQRADAYLREEVDFNGKARGEARDSYGWKAHGTRVAVLIERHLNYSIESAMKTALVNANASIVGGLEQAAKIKLGELASALKIEVKTR